VHSRSGDRRRRCPLARRRPYRPAGSCLVVRPVWIVPLPARTIALAIRPARSSRSLRRCLDRCARRPPSVQGEPQRRRRRPALPRQRRDSGCRRVRPAIGDRRARSLADAIVSRNADGPGAGHVDRRRSSRHPETRGPAETIVSSRDVGASMQPRRLLVVESRLRSHAGWLAASVGNQRQAMLVLAVRVRKHRALGDLHPRRRRRESNGFLTRAVKGDGMRVQ